MEPRVEWSLQFILPLPQLVEIIKQQASRKSVISVTR
jgi:hypothetical protein